MQILPSAVESRFVYSPRKVCAGGNKTARPRILYSVDGRNANHAERFWSNQSDNKVQLNKGDAEFSDVDDCVQLSRCAM